jgi:hypothetical protein
VIEAPKGYLELWKEAARGMQSSKMGCSLPAQRNSQWHYTQKKTSGETHCITYYQENYRRIAVSLYLIRCDTVYYSITELFTMRSIAVICSLDDMQFVVRYKPCKLICIFHRYDLISRTMNCEEPGINKLHEKNSVLAYPYS